MTVIDHLPAGWFLLGEGARLFLDVNCSYSAVSYSFLMELNDAEAKAYASEGHDFITRLAAEIQYSAPGVRGNTSPYRDRHLTGADGQKATEAITAWLSERRNVR